MASGDTVHEFFPYQNEPVAANYATLDLRNYHPVLDFDATTNEIATFTGVMPRNYAGGGVTVYIHWAASTSVDDATHCFWDAAFELCTGLDMDADSFAAVNSVDTDHPSTTSGIKTVTAIAFTDGADMDSVIAGALFRLQITRDAANDNMTGDAEVFGIEIKET